LTRSFQACLSSGAAEMAANRKNGEIRYTRAKSCFTATHFSNSRDPVNILDQPFLNELDHRMIYCHTSMPFILAKLINLTLLCCYVPPDFGHCYILCQFRRSKKAAVLAMTCNDYRGTAARSTLSKVFEHGILDRFKTFLASSDKRFGFIQEELGL
jgi:hypothetical protein